jgi:RNA polymerase sigma-70 factor (ECF subfamily)
VFDPQRFSTGEREYVRDVVRAYEPMILLICRSFARDEDQAEDLAQETWKTVCAKIASFRGEGSFRSWLHRVCTNVCLTEVRAGKARAEGRTRYGQEEEAVAPKQMDPLAETQRRELQRSIHRALPALSDGERTAVTLRILEGCSAAETAERMGVTPATVRSHIRHAIHRLRTMMEDPDNDLSRHRASS